MACGRRGVWYFMAGGSRGLPPASRSAPSPPLHPRGPLGPRPGASACLAPGHARRPPARPPHVCAEVGQGRGVPSSPRPVLQRFDFDLTGTGVGCGHGRPGAQGLTRRGRMRSLPPNCLPPPNPLTHSPAPPTHCPPACSWPASPTSLPCWPTSPCWHPTTLPSKLCWPTLPPR